MEEVSIKVQILGIVIPLKVSREEENKVRRMEAEINEYLRQVKNNFGVTDKTEALVMALLHFVNELHDSKNNTDTIQPSIIEKLSTADAKLKALLN